MLIVNIHAAKTQLSRLLDAAAAGEDVIIARAGKPVARLVALNAAPEKRRLGRLAGKLNTAGNFDAALPDDLLAEFEQP